MKSEHNTRSAWIKLRVTPAEKEAIAAKAAAQDQTVTDFIRQRALDYRLRQTPLEKERVRHLARIGANLNQLARWANIHKGRAEALDVLTALVSLENAVRADTSLLLMPVRLEDSTTGTASPPSVGPPAPNPTPEDAPCI